MMVCVDDEGGVWSARWGGSRVVRFTKDGELDFQIIFSSASAVLEVCYRCSFLNVDILKDRTMTGCFSPLPRPLPSCGAMGGDASRQMKYPDSGHLFRVNFASRIRGLERSQFAY